MSIPYSADRLRRKHVAFFNKHYKGKPGVVKKLVKGDRIWINGMRRYHEERKENEQQKRV